MANEMTPRTWPAASRGLMDDAAEAVRANLAILPPGPGCAGCRQSEEAGECSCPAWAGNGWGLLRRMALWLAPWGSAVVTLERGRAAALHGPRQVRVECLEGQAWVTCPSDGRDLTLSPGGRSWFPGPGQVTVSAVGGAARVRLGWK